MTSRPWPFEDADYDVVIIGGGMAGAGVARELALRGVSTALVEKGDFASATTSHSSKLIHGGLRYLELFDFALVRESLRERETLRRLAPHLVRPLPFLVPIYRDSSRSLIKVRIGLKLYDWLAPGRDRERYRVLPAVDALSLEPALRAERSPWGRLLLRRSARLPGAALPRERARRRAVSARGPSTTRRSRSSCATPRATINRGPRARPPDRPRGDAGRARRGQRDGAVGGRAPRAGRACPSAGPRILRRTKGIHCLLAAAHRARHLPLHRRRPHDLRHPVARVLAGRQPPTPTSTATSTVCTRPATRWTTCWTRCDKVAARPARVAARGARTPMPACGRSRSRRASAPPTSRAPTRSWPRQRGRFLSITGTKLTCFRSLAAELGDQVVRAARSPRRRAAPTRSRSTATDEEVAPGRGARLARRLRRGGGHRARAARRWRRW